MTTITRDHPSDPSRRAPHDVVIDPPTDRGPLAAADVARPVEEAQLNALLAAVEHGGPSVAVVTGEAGIGKSRLVERVVAGLGRRRLVLRVTSLGFEATRPLSTFTSLIDSTTAAALDDRAAAPFANARDRVGRAAASGPGSPDLDPDVIVGDFLRSMSNDRPLVVVLDDADLADPVTLTALAGAVRHLRDSPIAVVATVRRGRWTPGGTFATTLGVLSDQPAGLVLAVSGFDRRQLRALAESSLGHRVGDDLVDHLAEHSGGVPLYAVELLRTLSAEGAILERGGICHFDQGASASLTAVDPSGLLRRVFRDDVVALDLARHLAVVRRVRFEHLAMLDDVLGGNPSEVHAAFDDLIGASILSEHGAGWYRFAQPILADALYQELGPSRRREIHRRMIGAERSSGLDRYELATHLVGSADLSDRGAIEAALEAADALLAVAPLTAANWYQKALDLLVPDAAERAEILARRADALWRGRRPRAAYDAGRASLEQLPPGHLRHRTVYVVTSALSEMGRCREAVGFGALDVEEDDDLKLMAQRVYLRTVLGMAPETVEQDACDLGPLGSATAGVLIDMGQSANATGKFERTAQILDELLAVAELPGPSCRKAAVLEAASLLQVKAGCVSASLECLDRARALEIADGARHWRPTRDLAAARVQFLSGDWDETLQTVATGSVRCEVNGHLNALGWLQVAEARVMVERLQLDEASRLLHVVRMEATDSALLHTVCQVLLARVEMCRGNVDDAAETLDDVNGDARRRGLVEPSYLALDSAFETAILAGNARRAEGIAAELQALAVETSMPIVVTIADLARAEAFGDVEVGEAVLARSSRDRAGFFAARSHFVLASLGVDRPRHQDSARRAFEQMNARHWLQRLASLGESPVAGPRPSDLRATAVTITPLETRLIGLVRRGLSNREIAKEMAYSVKTIEVYLSRLYAKLGCRSRTELLWIVDS